jgi:dipeptidyl aminopeptidase/acylaminoacyl peptidase
LAGVDYLVNSGVADTNRIALAGVSWGGYLAAYALTHTDRFRAIFINEAVSLNMVEEGLAIAGNPPYIEFARQLGKSAPFEDGDTERLRSLSPIYNTNHARTPALLEFGANSLIKDGDALFQGLKHFNVPSELISYPRSGHGASEPALLYDGATRDLEWFAYWVLCEPTTRMRDRYGPAPLGERCSGAGGS